MSADRPIRIFTSLPPEVTAFLKESDFDVDKDDGDSDDNADEKVFRVAIYAILRYYFLIRMGGGNNDKFDEGETYMVYTLCVVIFLRYCGFL